MEELTEEIIQLFNERKTISSTKLLERYEKDPLAKVLAKLVEMDLIVLDVLKPSVWILK